MSKAVDEERETRAGEKAEAEAKRAAVIPTNFIFKYISNDSRQGEELPMWIWKGAKGSVSDFWIGFRGVGVLNAANQIAVPQTDSSSR